VTRFRQSLYEAAATSARVEAAGAGVALRSLHARGAAPLTPAGPQRTLLQRARQRNLEAYQRRQRGEARAALPLFEKALALFRKALPPGHPEIAIGLNNVATAALDLGQPERARDLYTEALTLRRQALPAVHPDIAMNLSGLAEACRALGLPGRVKALHEEALALYRRALPAGDPLIAQSLNNLAAAHHDLGQHDRARDLYEEALALRKQARPADPAAVAGSLNNLAHTYRILGQPGKARVLHEEALALWRKTLPAGHPYVGAGLSNLAADYLALGQPEKARTLFEEALAVARTALPAGHPLIAGGLNNLAETCRTLGQPDRARELHEEALAIRRKALPAGHPAVAVGLHNLALAELDLGLRDAAWRHARESAAIRTDHLRRVLAGSPQRDHLPLLAATPGPDLLFFLAERDRPSPKRLRELLGQVAARQSLAGLTAQLRHEAALAGADAAAAKLHASLKEARQRLADLLLRGAAPKDPAGFRNQCDEVLREQDRLERALAERVPGYAPLAEATRADPTRLAAALAEGEVLLTFGAFDVREGRRYAALLLWWQRGGGPQVRLVPLGKAGPLDAAVRAWRAAVQKGEVPVQADAALRAKLWGPIARALPAGTTGLVVAPEGQVTLLPLGALRQEDGSYLVEKLAIRYVGAARDLLPAGGEKAAAGPAVLVSDPAFDLAAGAGTTAGAAGAEAAPGREFRRLPGFAREAAAAEQLLRARPGWRVESLRGAQATEEALAAVKRPRLLYLITHGFFREDVRPPAVPGLRDLDLADLGSGAPRRPALGPDPRLRSGLALAGANRWRERSAKGASDGLLTAAEVENLDLLGTELVILSACETGLGEVQLGEGVLGLRRAFQLAGAQTVVASLWKVPDAQTELLMSGFLKRWLNGEGKADALRQAQLEMIRQLRQSADPALRQALPLYWAGFVCHGRPD
jgi:CHAT domain-containing protein/tetratricopeptide (TPR) repeat protein